MHKSIPVTRLIFLFLPARCKRIAARVAALTNCRAPRGLSFRPYQRHLRPRGAIGGGGEPTQW
jgi:hypothetical protein